MCPKRDEIDDFWNIGDMIPRRSERKAASSFPSPQAVEVSVENTLPEDEFKVPFRRPAPIPVAKERKIREYSPESGFIKHVKILPWPTDFGFYTKFRRDALRYFEKSYPKCEYVYFFSYMPQYEQMSTAQLAYYFYFRSEVRQGRYIKTDNSYLFLYVYEIINLPDKIPPSEGALLLSRVWSAYRPHYRYLDKYIGEWLCDYCLIYHVEPDREALRGFSDEIAGKVTLPEFYLTQGRLTFPLIRSLSSYDFRKSKYYADHREAFETYIPQAVSYVMESIVALAPEEFGVHPARITRDGFSGAVACREVKYKIELELFPLKRSYEMKQLATGVIKYCENQLRAAFAIKSRFSPSGMDERIKKAVSDYFDKIYPDRFAARRKKESAAEEEAYLALYEPANTGPADIERALAIERNAWESAALLGADIEEDEAPSLPSETDSASASEIADFTDMPDGDFVSLLSVLDDRCRRAIAAASRGEFSVFCHAVGMMPEMMKSELNEAAVDHIGDEILDENFTLIEDYKEDVLSALSEFLEDMS